MPAAAANVGIAVKDFVVGGGAGSLARHSDGGDIGFLPPHKSPGPTSSYSLNSGSRNVHYFQARMNNINLNL